MTESAVEVELVEEDRHDRPRRVPVRGVVVLLALALVAAVASIAVTAVHHVQRTRELAAHGFAASLADPTIAVWLAAGASPLVADRERVVLTTEGGLEARGLVAGERQWSLPDLGECLPVVGGELEVELQVAIGGDGPAVLWCRDVDRDLVVDPSTGTVAAEHAVLGTPVLATVLDGDVVRLSVLDDGRVAASRWSLAGELRWEHTTPEPVADLLPIVSLESGGAYARVTGFRILLIDLATGLEVDPAVATAGGATERRSVTASFPIPGGGAVEQRDGPGLLPQVVAVGPDGVTWWQVSGALARPDRDDGGDGDVALVLSGGVLTGLDARTGERLWSYVDPVRPDVLVDGVLVAQSSTAVVALRVRDGSVLWRRAVDHRVAGQALTSDGTVVVGDDGAALVAWGLRDGGVRWRSALPGGAAWTGVLPDGALLVSTDREVIVLR